MADVKLKSQTMSMSLAVQSAKGVAATTGFQTGLLLTSKIPIPDFDTIQSRVEHPSAVADRSSAKTSLSERTGYTVPISCGGFLYPRFFPAVLIAAGFGCVSTDMTGHYKHVLTLANDSDMKWETVLYHMGAEKDILVTDSRMTSVTLTASTDDMQFTAEGLGIASGDATGSETTTAEVISKILPSLPTTGGWTFTIGGVELTSNRVRGFTATIEEALDTEDKTLWSTTRNDLVRDTVGVKGTATDINLDASIFEKTFYGGAGNTSPDLTPVQMVIQALWNSSEEVDTGIPYSVQLDVAKAEITGEITDANEADTVMFSFNWEMVDDSATPITITVINDVASYYT